MPQAEEFLKPISESKPGGDNIRHTPAFDKLKEARREGGDLLSEGSEPDYKLVAKLGEDILKNKSKDLRVAAWLGEAWLKLEGFSGMRRGLLVLKGLVEDFWESLYPEIEEGDTSFRLASLDWFGSYLDLPMRLSPFTQGRLTFADYKESQLVGFQPTDDDYSDVASKQRERYRTATEEGKVTGEVFRADFQKTSKEFFVNQQADIEAILELLEEFSAVCEQKFTDEPPSFSKIRGTLEEILLAATALADEKRRLEPDADEAPAELPAAEETESYEGAAVEQSPARPAKRPRRAVSGIEPADHADAADRLAAVATFLRSQDMGNPSAYLLLRGYRWGELRASGSTAPDAMLLDPPSTEVRQQIKRFAMEYQWEDLIRVGEDTMASSAGRGWLDLQRYIVLACDSMGYAAAANAIKSELKCLLLDMPDLLHMMLMDDTPAANPETQSWISENILPPPPPEPEPEPAQETVAQQDDYSYTYDTPQTPVYEQAESAEPRPPDAFELAMEAARNGDREEAISILMREIAQERSGRGKFHRKTQLAEICLRIGRQVIARPILEDLAGEIEKRRLDEWETAEFIAKTLAMLYKSIDGDNERRQQIYNWICRLDPAQALACLK
jgi:type VI secretion system protein ImpA